MSEYTELRAGYPSHLRYEAGFIADGWPDMTVWRDVTFGCAPKWYVRLWRWLRPLFELYGLKPRKPIWKRVPNGQQVKVHLGRVVAEP